MWLMFLYCSLHQWFLWIQLCKSMYSTQRSLATDSGWIPNSLICECVSMCFLSRACFGGTNAVFGLVNTIEVTLGYVPLVFLVLSLLNILVYTEQAIFMPFIRCLKVCLVSSNRFRTNLKQSYLWVCVHVFPTSCTFEVTDAVFGQLRSNSDLHYLFFLCFLCFIFQFIQSKGIFLSF